MDGVGARAHFAVKRLLYHLYISTSMSSPHSTRSTSTAASKHTSTAWVRLLHPVTAWFSSANTPQKMLAAWDYPSSKDASRVISHTRLEQYSIKLDKQNLWKQFVFAIGSKVTPVLNVLEAYSKSSRFDPEGPLTTDCSSALQESRIPTARTTVVAFSALSLKVLWGQL